MSDFQIAISDADSVERGWKGLTADQERQCLYDLLSAIRKATELGDGQAVDDCIEAWQRHEVLAEAGAPEERAALAEEVRRSGVTMTLDEFAEWLEREAQAIRASRRS